MEEGGGVSLQSDGRSPHGERGLKLPFGHVVSQKGESLPSRGAWIEIWTQTTSSRASPRSLPSRGAWIEMIMRAELMKYKLVVAPLTGSVD